MSQQTAITPEDLVHWRASVGRQEIRSQVLDVPTLRRYATAVGSTLEVERQLPPLAHWAYFLETLPTDLLASDGHPRLGLGIYPSISLRQRMFAAASIHWSQPLLLERPAVLTLTLADIKHRISKHGDLVLVEVDRRLEQDGATRITERQTLVYRNPGAPAAVVPSASCDLRPGEQRWTPSPVELFRFSAVTFNSHRIHYDQPYAREMEGYPDLVVHGPLTAARLYAFAQSRSTPVIRSFSFRASAPLFVNTPAVLRAGENPGCVECARNDGIIAMSASVNAETAG